MGAPPRRDAELLPYDCEATADHAARLHGAGLLEAEELAEVEGRLAEIALDPSAILEADEDVHSAIERLLGAVGRKIHAGRSRNDQVAAAFRFYVPDACGEAREEIDALALVTLSFAETEADTLMPGYTHLQRGQPVTLGHHLLAWVEMLDRDRTRFAAAREAARPSPLGAGALAGLDARDRPSGRADGNSIDAVADRDFALTPRRGRDSHAPLADRRGDRPLGDRRIRIREAAGGRLDGLHDDAPEAEPRRRRARPRTGRGRAPPGLLATLKGLPLAYDRDLQEDKAPVFAARRDVRLSLQGMTVLVSGLEANRERLADAAADPLLLATDVAEELVKGGVPFREAHEQVAASVRDGSYRPTGSAAESVAARPAPGPGDVASAIAVARRRFGGGR